MQTNRLSPCRSAPPKLALRECLARGGAESLGDAELLALILSTGACGESALVVAARLLAEGGGLVGLARRGVQEHESQRGVGPAKAARLVAALELGRRANVARPASESPELTSVSAVEAWARPRLAMLEHEELWVLSVDARRCLLRAQRVALGGLHGCALTPGDVLRAALRAAASGFVLVHNHPSGDPTPSESDRRATCALRRACDAVGVPLLDHVVVARAGAVSVLECMG